MLPAGNNWYCKLSTGSFSEGNCRRSTVLPCLLCQLHVALYLRSKTYYFTCSCLVDAHALLNFSISSIFASLFLGKLYCCSNYCFSMHLLGRSSWNLDSGSSDLALYMCDAGTLRSSVHLFIL